MGKSLYFKKLDSLRFFAFFLVFWQHGFSNSFLSITENGTILKIIKQLTTTGGIGVHIFFVISGFLITYLMLKEEKSQGYFNIKFFYIRRILRIWPLYYLILISGMFILPAFFNTFSFNGDILKNLLFLNNFDSSHHSPHIAVAWSVAIEEQFYFCWPLIFFLIKNKKVLAGVCICLIVFSLSFVLTHDYNYAYFHTFGNINFLMTGCLGAIAYSKKRKFQSVLNKALNKWNLLIVICLILLIIILSPFYYAFSVLSILILPFLYLFVVVYQVDKENEGYNSVTSLMGKYTYGMYFYHPAIIIFTKIVFDVINLNYLSNGWINFIMAIIALAATIGFSILSYEYYEKYFLKLKSKFSLVKTRI